MRLNSQEEEKDKLRCFHTEVLTENQSMDKLPKNAVIIQFTEASNDVPAPVLAATDTDTAEIHIEAQVHLQERHCDFYESGYQLQNRCRDAVLHYQSRSGLSPLQWQQQACLCIVNGSLHLQLLMNTAWLP